MQADGIARDSCFGTGQQAVFAKDLVDQGRLARIGAANDCHLQWFFPGWHWRVGQFAVFVVLVNINIRFRRVLIRLLGHFIGNRHQLRIQVVQTFAMLSAQADRFAQAQRKRLDHPCISGRPFGLVCRQQNMGRAFAQNVGKHLVCWSHPGTGIDHEQADICHIDRAFCQTSHPTLQAVIRHVFQTCGIDHGEPQIAQTRIAFAQVARHARLVIDQSQSFANKAIEQCGLAHIRATHDSKGEGHELRLSDVRERALYPIVLSTESVQLSLGSDDIQRLASHNRRGRRAIGDLGGADQRAILRFEEPQIAVI